MLDKQSYKLLKFFYRKKNCTYDEIMKKVDCEEKIGSNKYIRSLVSEQFIDSWSSDKLIEKNGIYDPEILGYKITLIGEAYVEQKRRERRNFWLPYAITTFIALLSLIASLADNWGIILSWFG